MHQNETNPRSSRPGLFTAALLGRITRAAAWSAVVCLALGTAAPGHAQAKKNSKKDAAAAAASARVVVAFPPETKGGVSDQIADVITDVVQSRLTLSGKYRTVFFLPSMPTVRRGLLENSLTRDEVDHPVATDARIKKLTQLTGHDMAVVVSIIDYQYDKAANKVSMVLSAKLLDYTAGTAPRGTNRNGDSPDKPSAKATEYDLAAALARDLTEKMVSDLMTAKKPAPETK
jgi:hypothetical protein